MTTKIRLWIAGVTVVAMVGLIGISNPSQAGDDSKEMREAVNKIADLLKKGKKDDAQKAAATHAKKIDDMADLMHMFRPRNKGGMGVGSKPLANPAKDGIEVKIRDLARDVPPNVGMEAAALEEMAHSIAALAELSHAKGWSKDQGKRTKKAWGEFSKDMGDAAQAFAKAAAGKGGQEIKTAAAKVNNSWSACHNVFKD